MMNYWIAIFVVGLLLLLVWSLISLVKDGSEKQKLITLMQNHAGNGEILCKKPQLSQAISLCFRETDYYIGVGETILKLPANSLIEVSVETDGLTTTKFSRGSQLGGAMVGAIIAGPLGAAVGALSSSQTTLTAAPKDVRLRLIIEKSDTPLIDISFIEMVATGLTHGAIAKLEADEWMARAKGFMQRNSQNSTSK